MRNRLQSARVFFSSPRSYATPPAPVGCALPFCPRLKSRTPPRAIALPAPALSGRPPLPLSLRDRDALLLRATSPPSSECAASPDSTADGSLIRIHSSAAFRGL